MSTQLVVLCLVSFLFGSIPTGFLLVKWMKGIDIREAGSGNIGATNVSRVLGKKWGIAVFLFDGLKGFLPVMMARYHFSIAGADHLSFIGFSSFLGHCFSPWLHFKGGKGVATAEGVMFAVQPVAASVGICTYLITARIFKVSAVGSLTGVFTTFLFSLFFSPDWSPLIGALALVIVWRHKSNIKQLLAKKSPP